MAGSNNYIFKGTIHASNMFKYECSRLRIATFTLPPDNARDVLTHYTVKAPNITDKQLQSLENLSDAIHNK